MRVHTNNPLVAVVAGAILFVCLQLFIERARFFLLQPRAYVNYYGQGYSIVRMFVCLFVCLLVHTIERHLGHYFMAKSRKFDTSATISNGLEIIIVASSSSFGVDIYCRLPPADHCEASDDHRVSPAKASNHTDAISRPHSDKQLHNRLNYQFGGHIGATDCIIVAAFDQAGSTARSINRSRAS